MNHLPRLPRLLRALLLAALATLPAMASPASLPRSTPERQGIRSAAILHFIEAADREVDSLHSFMLVRHGHVVAEGWWAPYDSATRHELYSLSKSFTSTAVGFAVAEGRLSLDDTVLSRFPGEAPAEGSSNLKAMRLRDLLCMSTGHEKEPPTSPDQVSARSFLAHPVPFKPGTRFLYNTAATFMQSAMVQQATGETVLDYLRPRLFEPLGIVDPVWQTNFQGVSLGGYGLSVRTEDIAKFGQFLLQKGRWNGRQLLPASWVEAATARQTSNGSNPSSDWDQGYGFQFWRCRHNAYRGDGAFGQYCLVLPDQDAVIAITSGLGNMQAVLELVWTQLLPAMSPRPLPADPATQDRLRDRLAGLAIRAPEGTATAPALDRVAGRAYTFPANDQKIETLSLDRQPGGTGTVLTLRRGGLDQRVVCGFQRWEPGRVAFETGGIRAPGPATPLPVAASGAWTADDTYTARICLRETPFILTVTLRFDGDRVHHESQMNVAFGPTRQPPLVGEAR